MGADAVGTLITVCAFGGLGALVARSFTVPVRTGTWLLLAAGAVLGRFIGTSTSLVSLFGFRVVLSWAVVSGSLGALIGLGLRTFRLNRLASGTR